MQNIESQLLLWLPKLVMAIAIFLCFWVISKITQTVLRKGRNRFSLKDPIRSLVSGGGKDKYSGIWCYYRFGNFGNKCFRASSRVGLSGFALGFALKDTISNLLAGVMILAYQPFDIGDYIVVTGKEGQVIHIDFRYTTLENNEKIILIPNSLVFANTVSILRKNE